MSACGGEPCATRAGWSLGALVNSEELLLDLPAHLPCDMSLPAMWCSLPDWQAFIKKSNTWPHVRCTDESGVQPYQKQY